MARGAARAFAGLLALLLRASPASADCPSASPTKGSLEAKSLQWTESGLSPVSREYHQYIPKSYRRNTPTSVVFVFHGHGQDAWRYHNFGWGALADTENFVAIYPQGLADGGKSSWNATGSVESSDDSTTNCDTNYKKWGTCYTSTGVKKGGACHTCDWTTGYDDVGFVAALLDRIEGELCVDKLRIYAYGCSNGGMMVHELAQSLPDRFAAVAAGMAGKPHLGWEYDLPTDGLPTSMALFWGNQDPTILERPPTEAEKPIWWADGTWNGMMWADVRDVVAAYKAYNHCTNSATRLVYAEYDAWNMVCKEEGYACAGGSSVLNCEFDGGHSRNPDEIQVAWHFFSTHPQGSAGTTAPASTTTPTTTTVTTATVTVTTLTVTTTETVTVTTTAMTTAATTTETTTNTVTTTTVTKTASTVSTTVVAATTLPTTTSVLMWIQTETTTTTSTTTTVTPATTRAATTTDGVKERMDCHQWCDYILAPWRKKCAWNGCSGCQQCSDRRLSMDVSEFESMRYASGLLIEREDVDEVGSKGKHESAQADGGRPRRLRGVGDAAIGIATGSCALVLAAVALGLHRLQRSSGSPTQSPEVQPETC